MQAKDDSVLQAFKYVFLKRVRCPSGVSILTKICYVNDDKEKNPELAPMFAILGRGLLIINEYCSAKESMDRCLSRIFFYFATIFLLCPFKDRYIESVLYLEIKITHSDLLIFKKNPVLFSTWKFWNAKENRISCKGNVLFWNIDDIIFQKTSSRKPICVPPLSLETETFTYS